MNPLRSFAVAAVVVGSLTAARSARAMPTEESVFLTSTQRVRDGYPQVALFGYYFARDKAGLLGLYAGPRWTFGDVGIEVKTGAYGGPGTDARWIINDQIDFVKKWFSVTSFSDFYPPDGAYSYLSTFASVSPLFAGFVGDYTAEWGGGKRYRKLSGGPTLGVGTKSLYFGTTYMFSTEHARAIRLTVGITL